MDEQVIKRKELENKLKTTLKEHLKLDVEIVYDGYGITIIKEGTYEILFKGNFVSTFYKQVKDYMEDEAKYRRDISKALEDDYIVDEATYRKNISKALEKDIDVKQLIDWVNGEDKIKW